MFLPLMPKGVEHINIAGGNGTAVDVFLPLMPKGVEHKGREAAGEKARACSFR